MLPKTVIVLLPNAFYFIADENPPKNITSAFFFNIDDTLTYEPFNDDFGPLNIAMIYKYVCEVRKLLTDEKYKNAKLYHHTSQDMRKATNSALLSASFLLLCRGLTPAEAYAPFRHVQFRPFRDASSGQCAFECTIYDCLKALQYAVRLQWFSLESFCLESYLNYEKIENGDLNWIIPGKFIAFSCPTEAKDSSYGQKTLGAKDYVPIFQSLNVSTVIRLNTEDYNVDAFLKANIKHFDIQFTDGSSPPLQIVDKFLAVCEKEERAIAVHCRAGLGRTGTLIGCYAIKHYHIGALEYIAWARLCRPGSVLGPQQYFLVEMAHKLKSNESIIWKQVSSRVKDLEGTKKHCQMSAEEKQIDLHGENGQGKYLMDARMRINLKK